MESIIKVLILLWWYSRWLNALKKLIVISFHKSLYTNEKVSKKNWIDYFSFLSTILIHRNDETCLCEHHECIENEINCCFSLVLRGIIFWLCFNGYKLPWKVKWSCICSWLLILTWIKKCVFDILSLGFWQVK